jgi:enamine deaminase RidA (YjgF/YER057c/UK114 family)
MRHAFLLLALGSAVLLPVMWLQADEPPARRWIRLDKASRAPFSDAVLAGGTLYLAGRLGIDPATGAVPADLDAEMRLLFDGIERVLHEAGMSMDDLVTVQVYCPDLGLYDAFNAAYRARFRGDFPARAFIGSGALLRGAHFEMQGIAVAGR